MERKTTHREEGYGMGYFDKLKGLGEKAIGAADKLGGVTNDISQRARKAVEGKKDTPEQEPLGDGAYPFLGYVFYPGGGIGSKTTFFEDHMEHGKDEFPYADISAVEVKHVTTNHFTNGTAQITLDSGKTYTLAAQTSDMRLFLQAVGYAGDKANEARRGANGYKYGLHADDGTSLEIYEDCIIFRSIGSGLVAKTSKDMLAFTQLDSVSVVPVSQGISFVIRGGPEQIELTMPEYCAAKAKEAADHIAQKKAEISQAAERARDIPPAAWQPLTGGAREFPLNGEILRVPAELDLFNSYRLRFRAVANEYADLAREEYDKKVRDLDTFIMFFADIYSPYLEKLLQGCVDVLIAEGIWTETLDSLRAAQLKNHHLALDDYNAVKNSLDQTDQRNHQGIDTASSFVPTLRGGGFGLKGAMKGIATAEAFNLATGVAVGAMHNIAQVTPAQKAKLFEQISPDALFDRVFCDYWNVYLTLVNALAANGRKIWLPNPAAIAQAANIAKNLSNPNFPQAQATAVAIQILLTCPYQKGYQQLLSGQFGDTAEVKDIHNYFGYTDLNDIRITG